MAADGLLRRAQVRAVAGRVRDERAARSWRCTYVADRRRARSRRAEHCRISVGGARGQVGTVVGEEGDPRELLAIAGSVRQKLLVSSSPSSGRSGLPMITGAIALDQPR